MSKTILSLAVAGVVALGNLIGAPDEKPKDLDSIITGQRMKTLTAVLALTDEQQKKAQPIISEEVKALRAVREDEKLPLKEKFAKEDALREAGRTKLKSILTAEQQKKLAEAKEKNAKKSKAK